MNMPTGAHHPGRGGHKVGHPRLDSDHLQALGVEQFLFADELHATNTLAPRSIWLHHANEFVLLSQ
jgi:hypothetical protein